MIALSCAQVILLFILAIVDVGLSAIIATADCNFIRRSYNAELHLFYTYTIEFQDGSENQLKGTEIAIANAVAQALDTCDDMDRPLFAVKTGAEHVITGKDETAIAEGHSNRYFALGTTQILLDYFSTQAREEAYAAIRNAFKNATIIKIFDHTVVQTEYLHAVNEALVFSEEERANENNGELTVVVAIATGIVAFLIAALLCFGLMHERQKKKAEYNRNHGFDRFESISSYRSQKSDQISNNRSFSRLTNDSSTEYSMIEEGYQDSQNYLPSTIWSVSDITSDDSGSIRSLLSRTTSKLESIEEGEENEEMLEIYHRRRKRRTRKEYDGLRYKKGSVYISNLAQCQNSLAMPNTEDLEAGMAKDLPILLGGTVSEQNSFAVPEAPISSSPTKAAFQAPALNWFCDSNEDIQLLTMDDSKVSDNQTDLPTGTNISNNTEDTEGCYTSGNATSKPEPEEDGMDATLLSPQVTASDDSSFERDAMRSFSSDQSVARENARSNSPFEGSAHVKEDFFPIFQAEDTPNEGDLQIDTDVIVDPEDSVTPVTSNLVGSDCMIDTGSPSIVKKQSETQMRSKLPASNVEPLEASQIKESSFGGGESDNELDRNSSLYSLETSSDDSSGQRYVVCSFPSDESIGRESVQQPDSSVRDSEHLKPDIISFSHDKVTSIEGDLQIETDVVVGPEDGITPVTSNVVCSECMIDTGSPSILNNHSKMETKTESPTSTMEPLESSQIQESSLNGGESENALDRNTSLYSLDMDETILTFIDDIIAAIDDSKLLETDRSKTARSNTTALDEIQTENSNESFFVDDESVSDIEDSSAREASMNATNASIPQPKRRFVFMDVTNSVQLDELKKKKKRIAFDQASDSNTAHTL